MSLSSETLARYIFKNSDIVFEYENFDDLNALLTCFIELGELPKEVKSTFMHWVKTSIRELNYESFLGPILEQMENSNAYARKLLSALECIRDYEVSTMRLDACKALNEEIQYNINAQAVEKLDYYNKFVVELNKGLIKHDGRIARYKAQSEAA